MYYSFSSVIFRRVFFARGLCVHSYVDVHFILAPPGCDMFLRLCSLYYDQFELVNEICQLQVDNLGDFRAMLLINLIFDFCVVIVQAGCTPRAWLPSDLATLPLVCNLYLFATLIGQFKLVIMQFRLLRPFSSHLEHCWQKQNNHNQACLWST